MTQGKMVYEGKAKRIFATDDPTLAIIHYTDDALAFKRLKKSSIAGKGAINNLVSNHFFRLLAEHGIESHFAEQLSDRDTLVHRVEIVPVEVVVRNIAAGSLSQRIGVPEGTKLRSTVLEYCYKDDDLDDPIINETHIAAMGLATADEMKQIAAMAHKINEVLTAYLQEFNLSLIDFKLEFGRLDGRLVLADEISPDTCRFWDTRTGERLDMDRFRRDLGDVEEAYQEIFRRIIGA